MLLAAIGRYVPKGRGSYNVSGMEVESNGRAPIAANLQRGCGGGGDAGGGVELLETRRGPRAELVPAELRRCTCGDGGVRCSECVLGTAGSRPTVRLQLETWSARKTLVFAVVLGAFAIWAVVFGLCLNWFSL